MADLNKVFLMGRLTFDPELRRTPSGMAVADLRLATGRSYTGRDGERKDETLYIDVTVWDRQAETCCQYLKKGSGVHVDGYLKMDTWDDKTSGEKRSKIKVQAERVQFLDRKDSGGGGGGGQGADDEYGAPPPRDRDREPARRGPAPTLEPRGGGGNGGPPRGYQQSGPPPRRPVPEPVHDDEVDDIPF